MTIIIWSIVPMIWSMADNFCHFGPFFALLSPYQPKKSEFRKNEKNAWKCYHFTQGCQKWQSYDAWFLKYKACQTEFFVILDRFLHFLPHNNPTNQNFEKLKQLNEDIIILHKCNKNNYHMLYCFLDIVHNRIICYFSFWAIFYLFTSVTALKNQNLEKI